MKKPKFLEKFKKRDPGDKKEKADQGHLFPQGANKCVWMEAGLISYKLCDRDYECETCPFDWAMSEEGSAERKDRGSKPDGERGTPLRASASRVDEFTFYHSNHCWVKVEDPMTLRVGMDYFLIKLMGEVKAIAMPVVGDTITQGKSCLDLTLEDLSVPLVSPITGSVKAVNLHLKSKPELITRDPWGVNWLLKVKPTNLAHDLENLIIGSHALSWYQKEEKELSAVIDAMLAQSGQSEKLGLTMQDGGRKISRLGELLTAEQYAQILAVFVMKPRV